MKRTTRERSSSLKLTTKPKPKNHTQPRISKKKVSFTLLLIFDEIRGKPNKKIAFNRKRKNETQIKLSKKSDLSIP